MQEDRQGTVVATAPPTGPPVYAGSPGKVSRARTWTVEDAIDGTFFVVGAGLVVWLGEVLVVGDLRSWLTVVSLVVLYALVAYVGLPRLQQVLTKIYVPDYFIGRSLSGTGVLGDPLNLALDGSEAAIDAAMQAAGWTRADEVTLRSSWGIIVSSAFRRSYPAAPVSPLFLFGRKQAFAYEREVHGSASQRHHVRFWPTPEGWVLPGGYTVDWLAGGTYDRAVGFSAFTLQVTHKVDADVDVERDFVVASVRYANPTATLRVIEDFSTAFRSRNGGGDVVRTDGDLPVLDLTALEPPAPAPTEGVTGSAQAVTRLASLSLPPPTLLAAGVLSMSKAALTLAGLLLTGYRNRLFPEVSTPQLLALAAGAVLTVGLWLLTLRRHRWARTGLMVVCAAEAITQLAALTAADRLSLLLVATTSFAVLIQITVSSTDARVWVT